MNENPYTNRNDFEKNRQEKMQKRIEELLPDKTELPTSISIQEVEELRVRILELEKKLSELSGESANPDRAVEKEYDVPSNLGNTDAVKAHNEKENKQPITGFGERLLAFLRPPVFDDSTKDRIASLENIILWLFAGAIVFQLVMARDLPVFILLTFMALGVGFIYFLLRQGYVDIVGWSIVGLVVIASSFAYFSYGFNSITVITTAVVLALTSFLVRRPGYALSANIVNAILFGYAAYLNLPLLEALSATVSTIILGLLLTLVAHQISNSFRHLSTVTNDLRSANLDLQEKAAALGQRTRELNLATQVVQIIAQQVNNADEMLANAVELIRKNFDLYYTQIYLTDPSGRTIVLRSGTGDVGRHLLARNHRLLINSKSTNGRAVLEKQAVLVADTYSSESFLPNPLLPKTRSELVMPLIIADQVIGTLDMQSDRPNAFNEDNLPAFEALAGQMAVAVQNANLFERSERARREVEENIKALTQSGWQTFMNAIEVKDKIGYSYNSDGIVPVQEAIADPDSENVLNMPVEIAGAKVGFVQVVNEERRLNERDSNILGAIMAQLAHHIDSLRLLGQATKYRLEAEESARRLTREGWKAFIESQKELGHGFEYHQNKVSPIFLEPGNGHKAGMAYPIAVHDEVIGELGVDVPKESSEDAKNLIATISRQLSDHVESLRLLEQSERHRIEAENLLQEVNKTAERLREVDKMKSEFLANMSHELRTPLNSVIGYAEILLNGLDGELDDEQRTDIEAIYDNAKHLLTLINDVLDLAKIEAGRLVLKKEVVNIGELVESVKNSNFGLIHTHKKPVELVTNIQPGLPEIFVDPVRISQVLNNLVSNAIKFSERGTISLSVSSDDQWLSIEVKDQGIGIAEADLERIFERFSQVDGSARRRVEGTGLGLPITYHLVEMHGGSLTVESRVGEGSTFTVRLPISKEIAPV
ncbi:MAG: hypothetical protein DPW18_09445 [Chloroflexi bacterium]|nr:hypothetical protein [Chloroflexota bacterium]MDL1943505.1 GAF domain-containing sensor histidine kinase [Chloroflexi bacterium CFX2]